MVRYVRVALACVASGAFLVGVAALPASAAAPLGGPGMQRSVGFPKEGVTPPALPGGVTVLGTGRHSTRTHSHWRMVGNCSVTATPSR